MKAKGMAFMATIHVYKTYLTRRIYADKLVQNKLSSNPMAFVASKADEDMMYLHEAQKQVDWKDFKKAMHKEIEDHQG